MKHSKTLDRFNGQHHSLSDDEQGVQGFVQKCTWDGDDVKVPAIMKMSNFIDFVLELEKDAWDRMKHLDCLHFCPVLEMIPLTSGERRYCIFFKEINYASKNGGKRQNDTLANLVYGGKHTPPALYNCTRQALCAITLLEKVGITHYDLHADNIMVGDTPHDVHVYGSEDPVAIQTFGITPVFIDFGMAFVPGSRFNATSVFSSSGFTTFMNDPLVDARLLLVTIAHDMQHMIDHLGGKKRKFQEECIAIEGFIKKAKLMFTPININKKNGWLDDSAFNNVMERVLQLEPRLLRNRKGGMLADDNFKWMIELVQHMVTLPLESEANDHLFNIDRATLPKALLTFALEWIQVEQIIRNTKEEQLFFKDIVMFDFSGPIDHQTVKPLKNRFPKIKNIARILRATLTIGRVYFSLLLEEKEAVLKKRGALYGKLKVANTHDIIKSIPTLTINYKAGMRVHFMETNTTITLTETMAQTLNRDEKNGLIAFHKTG